MTISSRYRSYSMGFHSAPVWPVTWNGICTYFYPPLLRSATVGKFGGYEMLELRIGISPPNTPRVSRNEGNPMTGTPLTPKA
jgi:hypothetical protein